MNCYSMSWGAKLQSIWHPARMPLRRCFQHIYERTWGPTKDTLKRLCLSIGWGTPVWACLLKWIPPKSQTWISDWSNTNDKYFLKLYINIYIYRQTLSLIICINIYGVCIIYNNLFIFVIFTVFHFCIFYILLFPYQWATYVPKAVAMVSSLHSACWSVLYVALDTVNFNYMQGGWGGARLISIHKSIIRWSVSTDVGKAISTGLCSNLYESFQPIAP